MVKLQRDWLERRITTNRLTGESVSRHDSEFRGNDRSDISLCIQFFFAYVTIVANILNTALFLCLKKYSLFVWSNARIAVILSAMNIEEY